MAVRQWVPTPPQSSPYAASRIGVTNQVGERDKWGYFIPSLNEN